MAAGSVLGAFGTTKNQRRILGPSGTGGAPGVMDTRRGAMGRLTRKGCRDGQN